MKTLLMVTITCPDRPGIVEQITQVVVRYSANWEDSRLARLGGDFAGIVMISVAHEDAEALKHALLDLCSEETTIAVKITRADDPAVRTLHAMYELHLAGADHEGIVHKTLRVSRRSGNQCRVHGDQCHACADECCAAVQHGCGRSRFLRNCRWQISTRASNTLANRWASISIFAPRSRRARFDTP